MDWFNPFSNDSLQHGFIGRRRELDALARELLGPESRSVAIVGEFGSGKTSLAMAFANRHRKMFPGGAHHVHASPWERLPGVVANLLPSSSASHLLILDELEQREPGQVSAELSEIRRSRPSARLILIARSLTWSGSTDVALHLENFSREDFEEFIERFPAFALHADADGLFKALGGNPLSATLLGDASRTPRELFRYLHSFAHSGLVGADGRPLGSGAPAEREIISAVSHVNDGLLKSVHENPQLLYEITPRRFEEFVAEVLDRLGYKVTLTPASKDGGKDIYAAKKDDMGSFLYVVECKKYAPDRPVGVGLIRQLNGVVQAERATAGLLATTSFFTRGAQEFQARLSHQISLKDYVGIQEWLQKVFSPSSD